MEIKIEEVHGMVRRAIPEEGEDITEILNFDIDIAADLIESVNIRYRDKKACPFDRGNWLIDIKHNSGRIFCVKLPKEMTEAAVMRYAQPLIDRLKER